MLPSTIQLSTLYQKSGVSTCLVKNYVCSYLDGFRYNFWLEYTEQGLDGRLKHLKNYVGAKAKKRKMDEHMVKLRNIKVSRPNPPSLEDSARRRGNP